METLDVVFGIVRILLFAALIALAIYLIFAIKKIIVSINEIEATIDEVKIQIDPVIVNANKAITNVNEITANVKTQIAKVDSIVSGVQQRANSIIELEKKAQDKIEEPLMETLNIVSASLKGVKTFFQKLSDSRGGRPLVRDDFQYNSYEETPDDL